MHLGHKTLAIARGERARQKGHGSDGRSEEGVGPQGCLTSKEAMGPDEDNVESNDTEDQHTNSNPDPPEVVCG